MRLVTWNKADLLAAVGNMALGSDRGEPPRIHVSRDRKTAKYWLQPVRLEYNLGFAANEERKISALVQEHQAELLKAWDDYFKSGDGNGGRQAG